MIKGFSEHWQTGIGSIDIVIAITEPGGLARFY
jgi:hypothetical protein